MKYFLWLILTTSLVLANPADTNTDGYVELTELVNFINLWKTGTATWTDMIEALQMWQEHESIVCNDGTCQGTENCAICPSDCLRNGEVCCGTQTYSGDCCIDNDCSGSQTCNNYQCESSVPPNSETVTFCNSICNQQRDNYCQLQRPIIRNNNVVYGSCRAFSRKGNVPGFNKCRGYCKSYSSSTTRCTTNGQSDSNCDGVV